MSYKDRAKEKGEEVDTREPMMLCARCQAARKTTTLGYYGGMCAQCFGDYCRKPFQIPERKQ